MSTHPASRSPTIVIVEPHRELAAALEDVVTLAHCHPLTVPGFEQVTDLPIVPAAAVVRVVKEMPLMSPHLGLDRLPRRNRPMVVALASTDEDDAEARRLGCEIVVRAPRQIQALYEVLTRLASTARLKRLA